MPSPPPPTTTKTGLPSIDFYPEEAWFCLSVFLAIIGLFQWGLVLHSKVARQRRPQKDADEESTRSTRSAGWSLARLPLAVVNIFRVVAFRWTLEFGSYDLKVAEVFLTLAYIAFLLTWTFVGGESAGRFSSRHYVVYHGCR